MAALRNIILLFALVTGPVLSAPTLNDGDIRCAKTCTDSTKFNYEDGRVYVYDYQGTTETQLQGTSEQTTKLSITARAEIQVISKCDLALTLTDVSLSENGQPSTGSREFSRKLTAHPLRFAFQDGKIEDLCSENVEDERVINIKRGILSAFQNSMEKLEEEEEVTESDVSGKCPTIYKTKAGIFGGYTINKAKDILACTERNGNISSIHAEKYTADSRIQNAPLLKSTHTCEQDIKSGRLDSSTCTEVLMFRPFSKESSGAVTTATISLKYKTYRSGVSVRQTQITKRGSLLFSHVYDESMDPSAKSEVMNLLSEICSEVDTEITKRTPELFGALVSKMKHLDTTNMMSVYNYVSSGRSCASNRGKQFFIDAIPMVATEASLSLTKKLISENVIAGPEAEMWLAQLAFIPQPTYDMLKAVQPLLQIENVQNQALLGVSAMVHKLCEINADCQRKSEIVDFMSILTNNIGDCSGTDRDQLMVTLKALGNAGNAITTTSVMDRCITKENLDTDLKVAALQAYRRMPCSVSRDGAMRMYQDLTTDSELRIHAFLAVMSCPTPDYISKIRMTLSGESVNQVGSFVWTYLENIKESSYPLKQDLASILTDTKLREDFRMDARKFSRNIEKSFFSEYLNTGALLESNLIWSQKSYIPRSMMANVSVEMFGNSINLLEVGGRVQGLERIIEKFFGPDGYFTKMGNNELLDNQEQTAANYISPFDAIFKTADDDLRAAMYVKMFGNEIRYNELDMSMLSDFQKLNFLELLMKLSEPKRIDITRNYQFIDSSIVVPTAVGLPMNLTVNGTISVSMDVSGQVDLRQIAASPRSFDINGDIRPSAAVMVSGMMGVDAIVTQSSMKMVSSMHTSSRLSGKIQLQEGKVFNMELNTPEEKMEILKVSTEFFMNGQKMQTPDPETTYNMCTGASHIKVYGMQMCANAKLPKFHSDGLPYPPFTGPMDVELTLEKKDTHTGYTFTAKYDTEKQQINGQTWTKGMVHVTLDMPGSAYDKKMMIEGSIDPAAMTAGAKLLSPWKKMDWSGAITSDVDSKTAKTSLTIDGDKEYSMEASLNTEVKAVKTIWTPSLKVNMPNKPTMTVSGSFEKGSGATLAAMDLTVSKFTRHPITMSASLKQKKGGKSYSLLGEFNSEPFKATIDSKLNRGGGAYISDSKIGYVLSGRPEYSFEVAGKYGIGDNEAGQNVIGGHLSLKSTEFPNINFELQTESVYDSENMNNYLKASAAGHSMELDQQTSYPAVANKMIVTHTSSLKVDDVVDFAANIKHELSMDMKFLETSGTLQYGTGKTVKATAMLDNRRATNKESKITLSYPGRDMSLKSDYIKTGNNHQVKQTLSWGSDVNSQVSMDTTYSKGQTHRVTSKLNIPNYPISLEGSVRPDMKNWMADATFKMANDEWSSKTEWTVTDSQLQGTTTMKMPMGPRTMGVVYTLNKSPMKAVIDLNWADQKVSLAGEFSKQQRGYDSKITMESPMGNAEFTSASTYAPRKVTTDNSLTWNGEQSKVTFEYSLINGISSELSIISPYIQYGPVKSFGAKVRVADGAYSGQVKWSAQDKVVVSGEWSMPTENSFTGNTDITTPFRGYRRFGASLNADIENHQIRSKIYLNNKEAEIVYTHQGYKSAEFTLSYPGQTITASARQNSDVAAFDGSADFVYNGEKYFGKINWNTNDQLSAQVEIVTPIENWNKVAATFSLEGSKLDFQGNLVLTYNRDRYMNTIEFTPKNFKLMVRSPWRDVSASYKVDGNSLKKFELDSMLSWAADKVSKFEMSFDMTTQKKITFKIDSPLHALISGEAELTGELNNWSEKAEFHYGTNKFSLTSEMSLVNGVTLKAAVESPWKNVEVTASHTGTMNNWSNEANVVIGGQQSGKIYSEYTSGRTYSAKIGADNIPYQLSNFELSAEHKPLAKINTNVKLTWNSNKAMQARVILSNKDGYEASATFSSPFADDMSFSAAYNTRNGYEAKLDVESQWKKFSVSANRRGSNKEFTANMKMSVDDESVLDTNAQVSVTSMENMSIKWDMQTPHEMARNVKGEITHRGSATNFNNVIDATYNGQNVGLTTTFNMDNGVDLNVVLVNPWRNMNGGLRYSGVPTDFRSSASLTVGDQTGSASLEFSKTRTLNIKAELNTPFYETLGADLTLSKRDNTVSLSYGEKKIVAEFELNMSNGITATGSFTTPFKGYESGRATFKHTGNIMDMNFREVIELHFLEETASLTAALTTFGQIKAEIDLNSPWYSGKGSVEHNGNLYRGNNRAELINALGQTISGSSSWSFSADSVTLNAQGSMPNNNFRAEYTHTVSSNMAFTGETSLHLNNERMFHSQASYRIRPNAFAEFTLQSPWKNIEATYNHKGTYSTRCNADLSVKVDDQRITSEWSINMINGLTTEVTINTPWRNVAATYSHTGTISDFDNVMSVTYDTGKTVKLETSFDLKPEFLFNSKLTSPFHNGSFMYRHSGDSKRFTCRSEIMYNDEEITGDLLWSMLSGYEATLSANTPWKNMEVGFKTNDDIMNLESGAHVKWGTERYESMFRYGTANGKSASLKIESPWKNMEASLEATGEPYNMESRVEVSWETGKSIISSLNWDIKETEIKTSVNVRSPWRDMSASFEGSHTPTRSETKSQVSWEAGQTISVEAKLQGTSGDFTVRSPWKRITGEFNHEGTWTAFENSATFSWEAGQQIEINAEFDTNNGIKGKFDVKSPWKNVRAEMSHEGPVKRLKTSAKFTWGEQMMCYEIENTVSERMIKSTARIESPWKVMTGSYSWLGSVDDFSTEWNLSWEEGKALVITEKFDMTSGIKYEVTMACNGNRLEAKLDHSGELKNFVTKVEGVYNTQTISAEVELDLVTRTYGKVSVNSPWRNMYTLYKLQGPSTDMTTTMETSWDSGKVIKTITTFNSEPLTFTMKLESPWKNCEMELRHNGDMKQFNSAASYKCEGEDVFALTAEMDSQNGYVLKSTLNSIWKNLDLDLSTTGNKESWQSTAKFSWETGKTIGAAAEFSMSPMKGKASVDFVERHMETSFAYSKTPMTVDVSASWESGKEVNIYAKFDDRTGYKGETRIRSPWKNVSTSFELTGMPTNFESTAEFSWEPSKKVSASAALRTINGYKFDLEINTPFSIGDIIASFDHPSTNLEEFSSTASLEWKNTEKIMLTAQRSTTSIKVTMASPFTQNMMAEITSIVDMYNWNFEAKYGTNMMTCESTFTMTPSPSGSFKLMTPFSDDFTVELKRAEDAFNWMVEAQYGTKDFSAETQFNKNLKTGTVKVTTPVTGEMIARVTSFTDAYNWEAQATYKQQTINVQTAFSMDNGINASFKMTSPFEELKNVEFSMTHNGNWDAFTHSATAKLYDHEAKMTTEYSNMEIKQTLETTLEQVGNMEWEAKYEPKRATVTMTRNGKTIEVDSTWNKNKRPQKTSYEGTITVKTPFENYANNKMQGSVEYSSRMVKAKLNGHLDASRNEKSVEVYAMKTNRNQGHQIKSWIKSTYNSDGEKAMTFEFDATNVSLTAELENTIECSYLLPFTGKLIVNQVRSETEFTHTGSFTYTLRQKVSKVDWMAGSNRYMCETGVTAVVDGTTTLDYNHKTTWDDNYYKLSHDMTWKCKSYDAKLDFDYDFTMNKKTIGVTMYAQPEKQISMKAELAMNQNIDMMVEVNTWFDENAPAKVEFSLVKASQPWSVSLKSQVAGTSINWSGNTRYESVENFESSVTLASSLYKTITVTVKNAKVSNQWKPNMSVQWGDNKKIDLSGTFAWTNGYKAAIDLTTPFEKLSSLTVDFTLKNEMPNKFSTEFEFRTNSMSEKLASSFELDLIRKTLNFDSSSPFEIMRTSQVRLAMKPRVSALVKNNGRILLNVDGAMSFVSWKDNSIDFTVRYPFLNKLIAAKLTTDLDLTDGRMNLEADITYAEGKTVSVKYTHVRNERGAVISVEMSSPFQRFETIKYSVTYNGQPTNWQESSEFEFYYGKISTSTMFNMVNGLSYEQVVDGVMKNGLKSFNYSHKSSFTGNMQRFTAETSGSSSFFPTMEGKVTFNKSNMKAVVSGKYNDYAAKYTHQGTWKHFSCDVELSETVRSYLSTEEKSVKTGWTFELKDDVAATFYFIPSAIDKPNEDWRVDFSADWFTAQFNSVWKFGEEVVYSASYNRAESPFTFTGETKLYLPSRLFTLNDPWVFGSYLHVAEREFELRFLDNDETKWSLKAENTMNSDMEHVATVTVNENGKTYEFDGLYKNEGEGLVRDFKFHLMGPKGDSTPITMKYEFQTMSPHMVPGDAKFFFSRMNNNGDERVEIDMNAEWGNDHASITFTEPQPMKYSMDFSVSTRGQKVELMADWDTTKTDKNWNMVIDNRFMSYSQRLKHDLDIHLTYLGVSRGFSHELDWQAKTFSHKFTLDYNGKEIGYNLQTSREAGCKISAELISEWRNFKTTWQHNAPNTDAMVEFYWDSARDQNKKLVGRSMYESTGTNTYKWITTISHPALPKDLTLTDHISYDTDSVYVAYKKDISYSNEASKDISIEIKLEKNMKWGVELKQDFNNIDIRFGTEFTDMAGKGFLHYKAANGTIKRMALSSGMQGEKFLFELTSPIKNFKFEHQVSGSTRTMKVTVNGKVYTAVMNCNRDESSMNVKVLFDPLDARNYYEFTAGKIEGGYSVKLIKKMDEVVTVEGLAALSVSENKTITGKLNWNPELVEQLKGKINDLKREMTRLVRVLTNSTKREVTSKMNSMQLGTDFDRIEPHYNSEFALLLNDIEALQRDMESSYNSDMMFVKTTTDATIEYIKLMKEQYEFLRQDVTEYYNDYLVPRLERLGVYTANLTRSLNMKLDIIQTKIEDLANTLTSSWIDQTEVIKRSVSALIRWIQYYTDKIADSEAMSKLRNVHSATMNQFNRYSDIAMTQMSGLANADTYSGAIYGVHDYMNSQLSGDVLRQLNNDMSDKLQYYVKYYDLSGHAEAFMQTARRLTAEYLNNWLTKYIDQTLNDMKWTAYDVENGRLEFEITLPTDFEGIKYAQITSNLKQKYDAIMAHLDEYHFNYREMFYMYKPRRIDQILPPFDAYAIIAGQNIRTFDGRHYDFQADSCTYLLARDFEDGNFTMTYNYAEEKLTVHSNGKVIDLKQGGALTVDGVSTELPYMFVNTSVTRVGHEIILRNTLGLKVTVDTKHSFILTEMSGFYFGKTGGLFGTYNYEPSDDFTTSQNSNTSSLERFTNSWSTSCSTFKSQQMFTEVEGSKEWKACAAALKSGVLSSCHDIVDVKNAFHKCIQDMSKNVALSETDGPCNAAKFYQAECTIAGVNVDMPAQCVKCDTGVSQGEVASVAGQKVADVVFVFEEKSCNDKSVTQLTQLAKKVSDSLIKKSFTDIKFGVVGFGGYGVHNPPHIHTADGQIMFSSEQFEKARNALVVDDGEFSDIFEAIEFAAQYPYRSEAHKMMIVMACTDCDRSAVSYRNLAARLNSADITMNLFINHQFLEYSQSTPASSYNYGMDGSAIYTSRSLGKKGGDTRKFALVTKPKDQCSSMALQTQGTIFDLAKFNANRQTTKSMISVFSARAAARAAAPPCQSCRCEFNTLFGEARSVCTQC